MERLAKKFLPECFWLPSDVHATGDVCLQRLKGRVPQNKKKQKKKTERTPVDLSLLLRGFEIKRVTDVSEKCSSPATTSKTWIEFQLMATSIEKYGKL